VTPVLERDRGLLNVKEPIHGKNFGQRGSQVVHLAAHLPSEAVPCPKRRSLRSAVWWFHAVPPSHAPPPSAVLKRASASPGA